MKCNSTHWTKTGENRLLLCDTPNCLRGCHLRCLGLLRAPRGAWFCDHCSVKHEPSLNIPPEFQGPPVIPGSFLDIWAKNGALQFIHTKRLENTAGDGIFELRGIRFPRSPPKGDIIPKFNSCLVAVLNLAKMYEKGSLARETLRSVAKSLPALILPLRSHGSQTHISTNVTRFLEGRWELLWNDTLKYAANATVTRSKRLDAKPKKNEEEGKRLVTRDYIARTDAQKRKLAEYLHEKGAWGKANQSLTSDLKPTSDPKNVADLEKLHPRPMHPQWDPVQTGYDDSLIHQYRMYWESTEGVERLQKYFGVNNIKKYFRTRTPLCSADPDGWMPRELVAPMLAWDKDNEVANLIREELVLPFLTGDFHPDFMPEYAGSILFALMKLDGKIRPISVGDLFRRCCASLAVQSVREPLTRIFQSSYKNFIQFASISDGVSFCAKSIIAWYDTLDVTSNPEDPEVICALDVKSAYQCTDRRLTLDVINNEATRDYAAGFRKGQPFTSSEDMGAISNLFLYWYSLRMVYSKKRYFDNLAKAHIIDGETGGDQGDPLESCAYSLSTLHLIGAVMARHPNAVAAAVIDDLTLKGPLSEVLKIFAEIKHVLREDAGLELAVKKTQILSKNMSLDQLKERATNFIQRDPSLEPCRPLLDSEDDHEVFTVTGFKGLGVPIGTPDFITRFVAQKVKEYANDVDKLDILQDGKVHFDLLKFCHMPRFNYLNGLVLTPSLWSAQQHQFDYKVHDALIRKGTHNQFLSSERSRWVRMVLSLPIDSGGYGVTPNYLFRDAAFYVVTARWLAWAGTLPPEHHHYWLPQQTLDNHDTWTLSHLVHFKTIQTKAVEEYGCILSDDNMTVPAHAPPAACAPHTSSDDVSRQPTVYLPQLNHLSKVLTRGNDHGLNAGPDSRQNVRIPTQRVMTVLWSHHWQRSLSGTWKDIPQNMKEQLALHKPQRIPLWDKDSILRSEFGEPDQGDASQQRYLWWKPMAWLGIIRPTNQSEKWHMQQWSTFFCLTLGLPMPWISPGTRCACQKFDHDQFANHALTCNTHGGAAKSHDWAVAQVAALFRSLGNTVRTQMRVTGVGPNRKQRGDIELEAYLPHPLVDKGKRNLVMDLTVKHERFGSSMKVTNGTLCVRLANRDRPIEQEAREKIAKHRNLYNLLPGDIGFLPLVVSTSGRLNADFIRLVYLHATKETKNYLDAIDPVDAEAGHEADAAGGRRDRDFLVQRSRFLAALKTRLGLILAKAVAMRVMINATGCPAPVLDRNRMNTHKHLSQLIASAVDHDIPTPV